MGRRTEQPKMLDETSAQLVEHLKDANGWWRDTAQQTLVLRQDETVVPALKALTQPGQGDTAQFARIHAMWTLEGLGAADAATVRALMHDGDAQVRIQAIRVSETLYKAGDKSFAADYVSLAKDPNTDVVIQALLTLNTMKVADAAATMKAALDTNKAKGVQLVANTVLHPELYANRAFGLDSLAATTFTPEEQTMMTKGQQIYGEVCFACHGDDGRGTPAPGVGTLAPALASSPRVLGHPEYVIKALLHGLSGPINGATYPDVMVPMGMNNDAWVASIASYVRNSFGNHATTIAAAEVARVRTTTAARKAPWPIPELESSLPRLIVRDPAWKATASENSSVAPNAFTIQPWTSGEAQKPGMWFQVELPQPVQIAEVQFESGIVAAENIATVAGAPVRTAIGGGGRRGGRSRRARCGAWCTGGSGRAAEIRLSTRLQGRGVIRRHGVEDRRRGQGQRDGHTHHLRADASEIREDHADGTDSRRAAVDHPALQPLRRRGKPRGELAVETAVDPRQVKRADGSGAKVTKNTKITK